MKAWEEKSIVLNHSDLENIKQNIKENKLKFHQFYNSDFSANEYPFYEYLAKYKELDQKYWESKILNKTYYDIETWFDPLKAPDSKTAEFKITSIAAYNNIQNQAIIFLLKDTKHKKEKNQILDEIKKIYQESIEYNKTYEVPNIDIHLKYYESETNLIIDFFKQVLDWNTLFLIGFNNMIFDDPYTINRLTKLIGADKVPLIVSEFGILEKFGDFSFEQPDYMRVDLLKLYKPVDQGGSGMGSSLPSYKLDAIAEEELGINKLDLQGNFNEVFQNNVARFATYNLLDVLLTFKLDQKLQFIENIYALSKINLASVRSTITGRSFMFKFRNTFHYYIEENLLIRNNLFNKEIFS